MFVHKIERKRERERGRESESEWVRALCVSPQGCWFIDLLNSLPGDRLLSGGCCLDSLVQKYYYWLGSGATADWMPRLFIFPLRFSRLAGSGSYLSGLMTSLRRRVFFSCSLHHKHLYSSLSCSKFEKEKRRLPVEIIPGWLMCVWAWGADNASLI